MGGLRGSFQWVFIHFDNETNSCACIFVRSSYFSNESVKVKIEHCSCKLTYFQFTWDYFLSNKQLKADSSGWAQMNVGNV